MATIKKATNTPGNKFTVTGTLPPDHLLRHKLTNLKEPNVYVCRNNKAVAKSVRALKSYRQTVHGVHTDKLAGSLVLSAHYFLIPMSRSDSDNPRDRKSLENLGTPSEVLV